MNQNHKKPATLSEALDRISDLEKLLAARESTIQSLQASKVEHAVINGRLQKQFDETAKELAAAKCFDMRHVGCAPVRFATASDAFEGLSDQEKWKKVAEVEKSQGKAAADRMRLQLFPATR